MPHLVLRTIDGAADLLIEDLRAMSSIRSICQLSAETVECAVDGPLDELAASALYFTAEPDREAAEVAPLSWMRRFGRLERLPWSTNPVVAEVLVRLAKIRPGHRVLDPFCGTGTILLAVRRRAPTARVVGTDHDPHALEIATRNGTQDLARAKADALPFKDRSVDRVVTNLPFGKQVGSHALNRTLYPAVLSELDRVLTPDGRAVLLTEDKRLLAQAIQRSALKLVRERLLKYNGATPTAYVLTRPRRR
ncbi:methyltransferase domain-containing protein [Kribbella sp. NBC_00709]|uniref:TRM11 family SAM-dependent methyltransferase n=1 Tax=Kribbella sp. NBC_00709 TaxID=2975972 RepID=UPI002E2DC049|nr:methyltransferase domain-containing protein [Kribbella sp. NBC_00709]